jgi:head-tail adaptor
MRRTLIFATLLFAAASLQAQRINFELPQAIAAQASESIDVTLDGPLLRLAAKFLSGSEEERATREMVQKLEGIYVRTYKFDEAGVYDRSIVDRVRGQLGPTWKKLVTVKSKRRENTEIYADTRGDVIAGLVVISADPRELTFVNIVGPIDLEKLAAMEGQFGIPHVTTVSRGERHE